jgi:hypothetical protein
MIHPQASTPKSTRLSAKAATNRATPGYANKHVHIFARSESAPSKPSQSRTFRMETFNEASN